MGAVSKRSRSRAFVALCVSCVWLLVSPARAQVDAIESTLTALLRLEPANPREAAELVRALQRVGLEAPGSRLASIPPVDARHSAWRLAAGGSPAAMAALLAAAGPDGGFGAGPGHATAAVDTADVLISAAVADPASVGPLRSAAAVGALLRTQRPDGGFAANGLQSDLPTTALAVRALAAWSRTLPVEPGLGRALGWLAAARPGGPAPALSAALRADARAAAGALTAEEVDALVALRRADGLYHDLQGTAAALRALHAAAPNLVFEAVELAAVELAQGRPIEGTVTVRNAGLTAAPATTLAVAVGSAGESQTHELPALLPGASCVLPFALETRGHLGGLSLAFELDPDDHVREANEADNRRALRVRIRPPSPADLEVRPDLVALDPPQPRAGEPFRIRTTVVNRGDTPTPATVLHLHRGAPEAGGSLLAALVVPPQEGGGRVTLVADVPGMDAQAARLVALVDPEGRVAEAHRANNRAVRALRITGGADLAVSGGAMSLEPDWLVGVQTPVTVRVRVENRGSAASMPTTVSLSVAGGPPVDRAPLPPLSPGEVREVSVRFTPDEPRIWALVVEADADDVLVERDEIDNVATTVLESVRYELSVPPGSPEDAATSLRATEVVGLRPTITQRSSLPISAYRAVVRLGSPHGEVRGASSCVPVPAAPHGGAVPTICEVLLSGEGLPVGPQHVYYCVDADDVLPETDETDNCSLVPLLVKAHRDVAVSLEFEPPAPEPGERVTVRWRVAADPTLAGEWTILRIRADGRGLLQRQVSPVSSGQFEWTAPEVRGEVVFVATALADGFEELDASDNRVEYRVAVGGRPRIVAAGCRGRSPDAPAVAGRAGTVRVEVDAPTAVTFADATRAATPERPAEFPYTPAAVGESTLLLSTSERPVPAPWPCEVRSPGRPDGLTAEPVPEGVRLSWSAMPGATAYLVERDGEPLGTPDRVIAPTAPLPGGVLPRPATYPVELAQPEWLGGVALDMAALHRSVMMRWRLEAQVADGRWRPLHEETSQRPGAPKRVFAPVYTRRLRLVLPEPASAVPMPGLTLFGFSPTAETVVLDDRVGAEPSVYRVTARTGAVRSEDSEPLEVDRPLEGPTVEVATQDGEVRLTIADPPGDRTGGFLVEVDGLPAPDGPIVATAQWPVGLAAVATPWSFVAQGLDDVPAERRARAVFAPPRPISALPGLAAAPDWRAHTDEGRPFEPGTIAALTFTRACEDVEVDRLLDPTFDGPPLVDPAGGVVTRRLPAGPHTIAVVPLDHRGRRGLPTLIDAQSSGPRGLSEVLATPNGVFAHLTWTAPAEIVTVDVEADWGAVVTRAARPGVYDVVPPHAGLSSFRLVPRDASGHPGPVSTVSVALGPDLPQPENLVVTVEGFQVRATWDLPRPGAAAGYRVRVDEDDGRAAATASWQGPVTKAGAHVLRVAAVDRTGALEGPAARAAFEIGDDGPPPPPRPRPVAEWTLNPLAVTARFDVPMAADLAEMEMQLNDEPETQRVPVGAVTGWSTRSGVARYDARFRYRDTTGHASPWVDVRAEVPPAAAPTLTAGPLGADGTVPISVSGASRGFFVTRNGDRLCDWTPIGGVRGGLVALSSGRYDVNASPFGAAVPAGPWRPSPDDPLPTLEFDVGNLGEYLDRVRLHFTTADGVARGIHVEAQPIGLPWRAVAHVEGNRSQALDLRLPEAPRAAGRRLRFTFDDWDPASVIQLDQIYFETCAAPRTDVPPAGGRSTYTARAWGADGAPGAISAPVVIDVPHTDLVAAPDAVRLTDEEALVGDAVAVVGTVRNTGARDALGVDVTLSVAARDCARAPREIGRTRVDVPAGGSAAAVFGWAVTEDAGVLCLALDPENRVPESVENNNRASLAVGPDLPYQAPVWSNLGVAVLPCDATLHYVVRPTSGAAPITGDLVAGEAAWHALTGPLAVSGDRPFTLHVGELNGATSLSLRDCAGGLLGDDFVGDVPTSAPAYAATAPGLVVYAPTGATVRASEPFRWQGARARPSGIELFDGPVSPGEVRGFNPHVRPDAQATQSVRLEADAPVVAWSYSDLGFAFVGPDGRTTGRDLRGFVARTSLQFAGANAGLRGEEIALVSYDDENRVEVERLDTGEVVFSALLSAAELASAVFPQTPAYDFIPLRVRSTGRTAALNMRLVESPASGYMHAFYVPGETGLGLDRRFVVPATGNCRGATTAVLAVYDGTTVRVYQPDTGALLYETTLNRLEAADLATEVALLRSGVERRLLVETDRPVSIYHACDTAGAEMAPVLFDPALRPDLRITGVLTAPATPLPGDVLHVHAEVRNEGVVRARNVMVRIFDGEPAEGRLVFEAVVQRLDAGQPVPVDFELGVGEGRRVLVFVVDPDDAVVETREDNNRTEFAVANPPDLLPVGVRGDLVAGRDGALTLTVRNDGGQAVNAARVRVFADDVLLGAVPVDVPAVGEAEIDFRWRPEVAGPVDVTLEVLAPDDVVEARTDNNRLVSALSVAEDGPDLTGRWSVLPAAPVAGQAFRLAVRVEPPRAVAVEAWAGAARLDATRTDASGAATLSGLDAAPPGLHLLRLVVDALDEVTETDEANNESWLDVEIAPPAVTLGVVGPAEPVPPGAPVRLVVTPSAALPAGAVVTAPGFATVQAAAEAPVALTGLAGDTPGPVVVPVAAWLGDRSWASGQGEYVVAPADAALSLRVRPAVAALGEPVTLEAATRRGGVLRFSVDAVALDDPLEVGARGRMQVVHVDDGPGSRLARVELLDAFEGQVLAAAEAPFFRVPAPPYFAVDVSLEDQVATVGESIDVPVVLRTLGAGPDVLVDDVVLAVTDEPPTRVLLEVRHGAPIALGAAPVVIALPTGPLPWRPGSARLVARVESAGRRLGLGMAALRLLDSDATPPPDAAPPMADVAAPPFDAAIPAPDAPPPPPPVDASPVDPRVDARRGDGGPDPRADARPADAGSGDAAGPEPADGRRPRPDGSPVDGAGPAPGDGPLSTSDRAPGLADAGALEVGPPLLDGTTERRDARRDPADGAGAGARDGAVRDAAPEGPDEDGGPVRGRGPVEDCRCAGTGAPGAAFGCLLLLLRPRRRRRRPAPAPDREAGR